MSERLITQIDLLVHPDYHLVDQFRPDLREKRSLRDKWDERVIQIAKQNTVLLYFQASMLNSRLGLWMGENYQEIDQDRRKRYAEILGYNFFQFTTWEQPTSNKLAWMFRQRNLRYNEKETNLFVYGEYLELCVVTLQDYMERTLGISKGRSHLIPELSLSNNREPRSNPV